MFSYRILIATIASFLLFSCESTKPPTPVDTPVIVSISEKTEDGLVKGLPYKIEEVDTKTNKVIKTYFALGKDIDLDEFGGTLKFKTVDGVAVVLDGSFEFSQGSE